MKKSLAILICTIMCVALLASCDSFRHEHIKGEWEYNEIQHWQGITCTWNKCNFDMQPADHTDEDENAICDVCEYDMSYVLSNVAKIVLDYEQSLKKEIEDLQAEHPEYIYYYHPVDSVHFMFILDDSASADAIVEKYDMRNVFASAKVSAYNSVKAISVIFARNDFTEFMYQKIKQIEEQEALVVNLSVDIERGWDLSYMPKIEYYADDETVLQYTEAPYLIPYGDRDIILKTKDEYEAYLDELLESAECEAQIVRINEARGLYDESFFEENALILTKTIVRGSGSIQLTVNNLYISGNKVYVVVRTDEPMMGNCAMQYTAFGFALDKSVVACVDEVITLE